MNFSLLTIKKAERRLAFIALGAAQPWRGQRMKPGDYDALAYAVQTSVTAALVRMPPAKFDLCNDFPAYCGGLVDAADLRVSVKVSPGSRAFVSINFVWFIGDELLTDYINQFSPQTPENRNCYATI